MVHELRKDVAKEAEFIGKSLDSITLMTTLIAFGGLPGTGKTVIAREVAREVNAVYVRIDSIEQAIRASGVLHRTIDDAGYRVAYVIAEDNLRMGRTVVADCVNPIQITRDAWIGDAPIRSSIGCESRTESLTFPV
jgi:Cdc6-like AAA superfamily ATPase